MWQKSRNWTARFGPVLVLAFVACSTTRAQDVRTNYMPGTDFSRYHTYVWVDEVKGVPRVGGQPDQILDTQVKQAVDSQMAAKGLTKVVEGDKADLLLGYQLAIDREKQLNGFANGLGVGWGPWWGGLDSCSTATSTINLGTFLLGMYDPAAKKLIWIGAAQHTIEPSKKQEKNQERLNSIRERKTAEGLSTGTEIDTSDSLRMLAVKVFDRGKKQLIWRGDTAKTPDLKKDPHENYPNRS